MEEAASGGTPSVWTGLAGGRRTRIRLGFASERGLPPHPGSITKNFWVAEAKVDVKRIRLHDLRHTYATTTPKTGVHVEVVQEQLGHATVAHTIDTYSFALLSLHEAAAQKVAALVDGPF